jgi:galactose mutarotase-like enzyme
MWLEVFRNSTDGSPRQATTAVSSSRAGSLHVEAEARLMDVFRFVHGPLTAAVNAEGAELSSLAHEHCGELLWAAEPAWPQHAPNLFPIVGQLAGDALHANGSTYSMGRHGFARRRRFTWVERDASSCRLALSDDAQTREQYPYAFRLTIAFALGDDGLTVTYEVANPGSVPLPASVGAHPAFRWPLAAGVAKTAHTLEFSAPEPEPIYRLDDGLLKAQTFPSPIRDRTLELDDALFARDAIVMRDVASRSVRYSGPGTPALDVSWNGFRDLGLWSKAGGEFLCIEPWYGYASPVGFDGPFERKPGLMHVAPGASERCSLRIAVTPEPAA